MKKLNKIGTPIPFIETEFNTKQEFAAHRQRALIMFSKKDIAGTNIFRHGRLKLFMPPHLQKTGDYVLEYGKVEAVSIGEKWLKKGDTVACTYMLLMEEITPKHGKMYHPTYLGKDEEENEYAIPTIEFTNIFAKITKKKIEPIEGLVFCEPPTQDEPDKIGKIIIPDSMKTVKSDKRAYETTILHINKSDAQKTGLKAGDRVLCSKNSDIPIKLNGKPYIRVYIDRVVMKL